MMIFEQLGTKWTGKKKTEGKKTIKFLKKEQGTDNICIFAPKMALCLHKTTSRQ